MKRASRSPVVVPVRQAVVDDFDHHVNEAVAWLTSAQTKARDGARALARADIGAAIEEIKKAHARLCATKADACALCGSPLPEPPDDDTQRRRGT